MTVIEIQTTWTAERVSLLKTRINAGLSCGQIAREIGVSRNAVIGKANRLGLSRFKSVVTGRQGRMGSRGHARTAQNRILRELWARPQRALAEVPADSANRFSLLELEHWHCRWPIGDPTSEHFGFCGKNNV